MKILVTGVAGFIGFHLAHRLIEKGENVIGLDNINDYYDQNLKYARLERLGINKPAIDWEHTATSEKFQNFSFVRADLENKQFLEELFNVHTFDKLVHLAAQAGVRHSLTHPHAYIKSNVEGFLNILECSKNYQVGHLIYASSSSIYGLNESRPFSEKHTASHPVSLYAASKRSNELMAHAYSYLYRLPTTGLRFFTVYGPWGRPDMALFLFTESILRSKQIEIYNFGDMVRDFTYIDDVIDGILLAMSVVPHSDKRFDPLKPHPGKSTGPYRIYNIGNGDPVKLMDFVEAIEDELGIKADKKFMKLQPGDVKTTTADISMMKEEFDYRPKTSVRDGIRNFIKWYREYYL